MKHPNDYLRRSLLLAFIVFATVGILSLIWKTGPTISAAPSSNLQTATPYPYPTDYPPAKQTLETRLRLTQDAAKLTPFPTGTHWFIPQSTSTPGPWELTPPPATPAGDGQMIDMDRPSLSKLIEVNILNVWYAEVDGRQYNVFAGSDYYDPVQGMVYIVISTPEGTLLTYGDWFPTATRSGAVRIVGAEGLRLILLSTEDETFYFDVLGQQFTASLTDPVPTVTPWPITPRPSPTSAFSDDAPNRPYDIPGLSPVNTDLQFTINPRGDVDWFRFYLATPGTFQVELINLPANYDLYVFSVSHVEYGGKSTQAGTTDEIVTIQNAPVDDYLVRVEGVNGAFDPTNPYRLRFNVLPRFG